MKIKLSHNYNDIICLDNLLEAWQEFIIGKKNRTDAQIFERELMDNILSLHQDLASKTYSHGSYHSFCITDPKLRHIHKASVRDRLLHHAIYRTLYLFFDKTFISDSYSCRIGKGMHKAINRFRSFAYKVSKNHTKTCYVLKCDIKKFFASIDHNVLIEILKEYIPDKEIIWLLENIIGSFDSLALSLRGGSMFIGSTKQSRDCHASLCSARNDRRIGLPLGNLTSQLFANVYMNKLDQYVKHKLKAKYYIRYADDFVIFSQDKCYLENLISKLQVFLQKELKLSLHPNKVFIKTLSSGADFLGWIHFPHHRILRKTTKKRMLRRIKQNPKEETLQSYLGLLSHGNTDKVRKEVLMDYWLCRSDLL